MRISSAQAARVTILSAVVSSAFACNEPTAAPRSSALVGLGAASTASRTTDASHATSFGWVTGTPTPGTASPYAGFGVIQLQVGRLFPPGPCVPAQLPAAQRGRTLVSVCAFIENGGGSPFVSLTLMSSPDTPRGIAARGIASVPPGPCRTYLVRGAFALDDATARAIANHPADLAAIFGFQDVDDRPANEMRGMLGMAAPPEPDRVLHPVGTETCVVDVTQRAVVGGV